jgi:hypothetical protein
MAKLIFTLLFSSFMAVAANASEASSYNCDIVPPSAQSYEVGAEVASGLIPGSIEDRSSWAFLGCTMDYEDCHWCVLSQNASTTARAKYNAKSCPSRGMHYACFSVN